MEIITYYNEKEETLFYSKEEYIPLFWKYLVSERIKKNMSYEVVDNNVNYFIKINLKDLKKDTYFEDVKSESYQRVLLAYWNYFIDYLSMHNEVIFSELLAT